jgi:ribosomal-protein-alanine N-acetyltransferase
MELRTDRLLLRRAQPGDLPGMHAILSDPLAMRYWSTLPHETLEQSAAFFQTLLRPPGETNDECVIVLGDAVIGKIGIWNMPELGFILAPAQWGKGYASEAAKAFVRYIFESHPIEAITADIDPRNTASRAVLTKVGFVETGTAARTYLIGGEWFDSVYFELPRERVIGPA